MLLKATGINSGHKGRASRRDIPVAKVLFNDTGINSGRRGTQGGGDGNGQDGQGFVVGHLG